MVELLRALRLGAVNLFGVAIPGFLLLFISGVGFLLPMLSIVLSAYNHSLCIDIKWYDSNKWLIVSVIILMSYISGFILRLTSPHELDKVSVTKRKSHVWDYSNSKEQFPYSKLKSYFEDYGHPDLAALVAWKTSMAEDDNICEAEQRKCSSTIINRMKLDIALDCPSLAAFVDSNEAHIRLMSGTWLAIKATKWLVLMGLFICIGVLITHKWFSWLYPHPQELSMNTEYYWLQLVINVFMFMAMWWGLQRIQELFHRRRVNELLIIFHAALRCKQQPAHIPGPGLEAVKD